jgi:hypothetical protein
MARVKAQGLMDLDLPKKHYQHFAATKWMGLSGPGPLVLTVLHLHPIFLQDKTSKNAHEKIQFRHKSGASGERMRKDEKGRWRATHLAERTCLQLR